MSYSDELKVLIKKTAKARIKRGLSCEGLKTRCERTMNCSRRYIFVWLNHCAGIRRDFAQFGSEGRAHHLGTLRAAASSREVAEQFVGYPKAA